MKVLCCWLVMMIFKERVDFNLNYQTETEDIWQAVVNFCKIY